MFKYVLAAIAFVMALSTSPVKAGNLSSPWDEPELTPIQCPLYGILGLRWRWCPGVGFQPADGNDPEGDKPEDDKPEDDNPTDGKPKPDRLKANASNHANERANNNDGKGGKDRDTSRNNDKGTHANRSP